MGTTLHGAAHWKNCADEARVLASDITDHAAKTAMTDIAEAYDRIAERATVLAAMDHLKN